MCYRQAFSYIKCEVPDFDPYSGGLDLELSFFDTACEVFPNMKLIGCLFHFKKGSTGENGDIGNREAGNRNSNEVG